MLKKLIIPAILAFSFASHAAALTGTGKFKKKAYKIKGTWFLAEVEGKQVIAFDEKFKTKDGPDLKIFLSKKTTGELKKNPTFIAPVALAPLKGISGKQHYVLPSDININDYKSILIHCEEFNVLWGGFNMPEPDAWKNQDSVSNLLEDSNERSASHYGS